MPLISIYLSIHPSIQMCIKSGCVQKKIRAKTPQVNNGKMVKKKKINITINN